MQHAVDVSDVLFPHRLIETKLGHQLRMTFGEIPRSPAMISTGSPGIR